MAGVRPHEAASYWTPDEVAEALDGISAQTSARLWALLPQAGEQPASEWPEPVVVEASVASIWQHLTEAERAEINAAFVALDTSGC
jgi:hypothetical protein